MEGMVAVGAWTPVVMASVDPTETINLILITVSTKHRRVRLPDRGRSSRCQAINLLGTTVME
jgi:hypothetical protein